MTSAPATGTRITHGPSVWPSGVTSAVEMRWKKNRLVNKPISFSSAQRDVRADHADGNGGGGNEQ